MKTLKKFLLLSAASLCASVALTAQNAGEIGIYVGAGYSGSQALNQTSDAVSHSLLGTGGISAALGHSTLDSDFAEERRYDGDHEVFSGTVGYTHVFEAFNAGVFISALDNEIDADGFDANEVEVETEGDGFLLSFGIGKTWDKFTAVAQGGFGEMSFDSERNNLFGSKETDYDLSFYYLSIEVMYELFVNDKFAVSPYAGLGIQFIETDDFEESGAVDPANVDSFDNDTPFGEIGVRVDYIGAERYKPYASVSLWSDLGDDQVDIEGDFNGIIDIDLEVEDAMSTVFQAELGLDVQLSDNATLDAGLNFFSGDDADGVVFRLAAGYSF